MAITDKEEGVWLLDEVYAKQNEGDIWGSPYVGSTALYTWGNNSPMGCLGQNNLTQYSSPIQVGTDTTWSAISNSNIGDSYWMIATKTDGTLWSWGRGGQGRLGVSNNTQYSSPVQVGTDTTWSDQISRDGEGGGSFAIKTDGTLWSWGNNSPSYGQLGHNNKTNYDSPKQVPGSWSKVSNMSTAAITIKADGTLWTWGANSFGMLGIGGDTAYSSPKQVGTDTTWSSVSGGAQFGSAIKTDGTLWAWGVNEYGQLATNDQSNLDSPNQIPGSWSKVGCTMRGISAIKTDGTMWCWGSNEGGSLGQNQKQPNIPACSSPVQVPGTDWANVIGGHTHVLATKTNGTLWGWGQSNVGQLGLNETANRSSPTQIPGSWNIGDNKLAAINYSSAAITNA